MKMNEFYTALKNSLGLLQSATNVEVLDTVTELRDSHRHSEKAILEKINESASRILKEPLENLSQVYSLIHGLSLMAKQSDSHEESLKEIIKAHDRVRKVMHRISAACGKKFEIDVGYEDLPKLVEELLARANMVTESEELYGTFNGLKELFELPESTGLAELSEAIGTVIYERDDALQRVTAAQQKLNTLYDQKPQLSEERYVLHGDIKPCTVLYSDDTTTLLRLPEGDMMCETETIEWSDSVTYRCQELLRGESKRSGHRVSLPTVKAMAQLVRDERILLNDNGGEENPNSETLGASHTLYVSTLNAGEISTRASNVSISEDAYAEYVKGSYAPMTRKEWEQAGRPEGTVPHVKPSDFSTQEA